MRRLPSLLVQMTAAVILPIVLSSPAAAQQQVLSSSVPDNSAYPSSTAPHPLLETNAQAWKEVFVSLIKAQQWDKAAAIDHLATTSFAATSLWHDPQFLRTWSAWRQQKMTLAWKSDADRIGMWRLAEGTDPHRPSLGLRQERDGQWWLVFVSPAQVLGAPQAGWPCAPQGCPVTITTPTRSLTLSARPPNGADQEMSTTLGTPLPVHDIPLQEGQWRVVFPGNPEPVVFDMSYANQVCHRILQHCWEVYDPSQPSQP